MSSEMHSGHSWSAVQVCQPHLQDILNVVMESGQDFDTVCMATAVHRMAKMDAGDTSGFITLSTLHVLTQEQTLLTSLFHPGSTHYEYIAALPEFERLLRMIGTVALSSLHFVHLTVSAFSVLLEQLQRYFWQGFMF